MYFELMQGGRAKASPKCIPLTYSGTDGCIEDLVVIIPFLTAEILGEDVTSPKYTVVVKTDARMSIGRKKFIARVAFALFVMILVVLQIANTITTNKILSIVPFAISSTAEHCRGGMFFLNLLAGHSQFCNLLNLNANKSLNQSEASGQRDMPVDTVSNLIQN